MSDTLFLEENFSNETLCELVHLIGGLCSQAKVAIGGNKDRPSSDPDAFLGKNPDSTIHTPISCEGPSDAAFGQKFLQRNEPQTEETESLKSGIGNEMFEGICIRM